MLISPDYVNRKNGRLFLQMDAKPRQQQGTKHTATAAFPDFRLDYCIIEATRRSNSRHGWLHFEAFPTVEWRRRDTARFTSSTSGATTNAMKYRWAGSGADGGRGEHWRRSEAERGNGRSRWSKREERRRRRRGSLHIRQPTDAHEWVRFNTW